MSGWDKSTKQQYIHPGLSWFFHPSSSYSSVFRLFLHLSCNKSHFLCTPFLYCLRSHSADLVHIGNTTPLDDGSNTEPGVSPQTQHNRITVSILRQHLVVCLSYAVWIELSLGIDVVVLLFCFFVIFISFRLHLLRNTVCAVHTSH